MKSIKYSFLLLPLLVGACKKDTASAKPAAAKPVARFSAPASVSSNTPLQVANESSDATDFLWTWGDGTTSTDANPMHEYDWYGKVRIKLQATSAGGTDTTSKILQIGPGTNAPAGRISAIVGRYSGRLYYRADVYNGPAVTWRRDTIVQLTAVNSNTVHLLYSNLEYVIGSSRTPSAQWAGHLPQRPNIAFSAFSREYLQCETNGDSVYYNHYFGGVAYGTTYKFYGKKMP